MKYLNKIKNAIICIYSNIKYILTNDLRKLDIYSTNHIESIENKMFEMDDIIKSNTNDIDDKCDECQVKDIIYNQFGCVDDLATYDDINDVKDDIKTLKTLCDILKDNNDLLMTNKDNNDYRKNNLIERDLLVDYVIKRIVNQLVKANRIDCKSH